MFMPLRMTVEPLRVLTSLFPLTLIPKAAGGPPLEEDELLDEDEPLDELLPEELDEPPLLEDELLLNDPPYTKFSALDACHTLTEVRCIGVRVMPPSISARWRASMMFPAVGGEIVGGFGCVALY
jgi:hypothetical protein